MCVTLHSLLCLFLFRHCTWEPEENILDDRLILGFEKKWVKPVYQEHIVNRSFHCMLRLEFGLSLNVCLLIQFIFLHFARPVSPYIWLITLMLAPGFTSFFMVFTFVLLFHLIIQISVSRTSFCLSPNHLKDLWCSQRCLQYIKVDRRLKQAKLKWHIK